MGFEEVADHVANHNAQRLRVRVSLPQWTWGRTGPSGRNRWVLLSSSRRESRMGCGGLTVWPFRRDRRDGLSEWVCALLSFCFHSSSLRGKVAFSSQSSQTLFSEWSETRHAGALSRGRQSWIPEWSRSSWLPLASGRWCPAPWVLPCARPKWVSEWVSEASLLLNQWDSEWGWVSERGRAVWEEWIWMTWRRGRSSGLRSLSEESTLSQIFT